MRSFFSKFLKKYKDTPLPVKASAWIFICNILQKSVQMLTVPIITRMLTAAEYGIYNVFTSWFNIIIIFASLKLSSNGYYVAMKKFGENSVYPSSVAGLTFALLTVWTVLVVVFQQSLAEVTGLSTIMLLAMSLLAYGDSAINLWYADNRYTYRYKNTVICTALLVIVTPILKILFIGLANNTGYDKSLATVWGLVIPKMVVGMVAWIALFNRGKKPFVKEHWKFAVSFNIPLVPYYLSQVVLNQSDRIMINSLDSATSAGLYSVTYSLASVMQFIHAAINNGYIPWQFKALQKGDVNKVKKVSSLLTVVVGVAYAMVVFCAPELMRIFAAEEYYDAIYCVPPVVMGIFMQWIAQLFINVEFYHEKNKILSMTSIVSAVLNIVLNFIAIPRFGYISAAYTTLICYSASAVFHAFVAKRLSKQKGEQCPLDMMALIKTTGLSSLVIFGTIFLYPYALARYSVLAVIIAVLMIKRKMIMAAARNIIKTLRNKNEG